MENRDNNKDIDIREFTLKISMLKCGINETPISYEFDEKYGQKERRWWSSQREHLTVWCLYQPTDGGKKGYKHKPNFSTRYMYNHFGRPETLLWLAEAIGIKKAILIDVVNLIKDIKSCRTQCKLLIDKIPFDMIYEKLVKINY